MLGEVACCGCAGMCALLTLIVLAGITQLGPTYMALRYNWVLKTVDPMPVTQGGLYCAPFIHFMQYPKTEVVLSCWICMPQ